jgi:hypothetical protein
MVPADYVKVALVQEVLFPDKWITHYWDGERVLGQVVSQHVKLATHIARSGILDALVDRTGSPPSRPRSSNVEVEK